MKIEQYERYAKIQFGNVDSAINFLEIVLDSELIPSNHESHPSNILKMARDLLNQYKNWLINMPTWFSKTMIESKPTPPNNEEKYEEKPPLQELGQKCSQAWKLFKKVLAQFEMISSKAKVVEYCDLEVDEMKNAIEDAFTNLENFISKELDVITKNKSKQDVFNILLKKVSIFFASDERNPIYGQKAASLIRLKEKINNLTEEIHSTATDKVTILFKDGQFESLKGHLEKVRKEHDEEDMFPKAVQNLKNGVDLLLKDQEEKIKNLKKNKGSLTI